MRRRALSPITALVAALAAGLLLTATTLAATATLTADLADAGSGDADGSGSAEITLDTETAEVCWELEVSGIGDVVASHIHVGAAGEDGGVVVPLDTDGFSGSSSDCATVADADLDAIIANPAGYYVNIHTAEFSAGAIRGQLAAAGGTPNTAMPSHAPNLALIGLLLLVLGGGLAVRAARRAA